MPTRSGVVGEGGVVAGPAEGEDATGGFFRRRERLGVRRTGAL